MNDTVSREKYLKVCATAAERLILIEKLVQALKEARMEFGKAVWYVGDGEKKVLAFVTATNEAGEANLTLADGSTHKDVARRAPKDYGPEGGGHTWHLQSESE